MDEKVLRRLSAHVKTYGWRSIPYWRRGYAHRTVGAYGYEGTPSISQLSHTRKIVVTARVGDALASEPLKVTYVRVFMCSSVSYAIYAEKQPDTHSLWALDGRGLSC